jgi:hypothetical protein
MLSQTPTDGSLPVTVGQARRAGPRVRLALHDPTDAIIDAEISYERFAELGLRPGERTFLLPRNVHVFGDAPPADVTQDSVRPREVALR